MKQAVFEARYSARWREFEHYLNHGLSASAKRKKEKAAKALAASRAAAAKAKGQASTATVDTVNPYSLPPSAAGSAEAAPSTAASANTPYRFPASEFAARYRELAQHVALARDRHYSGDLVAQLEVLAMAGHQVLYRNHDNETTTWHQFIAYGLPMLVRARWRSILAATLLFYVPLFVSGLAVYFFPEFVYQLMDAQSVSEMHSMYSPENQRVGRPGGSKDDFQMFTFYIWNNVSIDFKCFASGLLFGVGTIFVLVFNGLHIGAAAGYLTGAGLGETFWSFVAGHSALELTGIVLAGAAGLEMGYALVAPGGYSRVDALRRSMRYAVGLIVGAALLTALAAIVEGFWSANTIVSREFKYTVGVLFWAAVIGYLALARQPNRGKTMTAEMRVNTAGDSVGSVGGVVKNG